MKKLMRMKMRTASFDVANLPDSVTWKLTDAENNNWAPFVGNEMVTKAQQKLWEETFELAMLWEDWPGHVGTNFTYTLIFNLFLVTFLARRKKFSNITNSYIYLCMCFYLNKLMVLLGHDIYIIVPVNAEQKDEANEGENAGTMEYDDSE